jgi:hypothetical protein
MENYDTVVEALNGLRLQGYTTDFNIELDRLICTEKKIILHPEDFEITKVFRFEGDSNPDDEEVVYAIESKDGKTKGVFVSAYGMYAEAASGAMLKKLGMHR